MLRDKGNDFWFEQSTAAWAVGNIDSPSIDLLINPATTGQFQPTNRKIFSGKLPDLHMVVRTTFVGATATVQFILQDSADDAAFANLLHPGSATQIVASPAYPVADLIQGFEPTIEQNPNTVIRRYLRMRATIATANITAGAFTAGFVVNRQTNHI